MGASLQWRNEPQGRKAHRYGRMVHFGTRRHGGVGYMSYSERVGPGVLVVHDEFGLAGWLEDLADSLTAEGFTVLVPDLYDGRPPETVEDAERRGRELGEDPPLRTLEAAASFLTDNWHPRLGAIGYSFGADVVVSLGRRTQLDAVALYYPGAMPEGMEPLIGHLVSNAATPTAGEVEAHVYEAGRLFANPGVNVYEPTTTDIAHERTLEFLRYHLS